MKLIERADMRLAETTDAKRSGGRPAGYKIHAVLIFMYILITPLSMVEIPGLGSAMKILSILLLLIGILLLISEDAVISFKNRLALAWTAYVAYTALSCFWSADFETSFVLSAGLIQVLVLSLVLAKFDFHEEELWIIEGAWFLVSLICLLLFFGGAGQQYEYGGRTTIVLSSGGADPNEFCAYFYMTLAFLTVRLCGTRLRPVSLVYFSYMLLLFYCILLTGSRGGLLAAFAAVGVVWMFSASAPLKKIALLCVTLAALYLIFTHFFIPNLPQAIWERYQPASIIQDRGSERAEIWETAFSDIFSGTSRLIYGYGPFGATFMRSTMHNQFIQVLMDGGILGLLLYGNLCVELLKKAYRNGPACLGGMVAAFTALLTLSAYAFFKPIWVIFLMGLLTIKRRNAA